ncbi:MAG: transketolase [Zetaproteobacteria bacterium]|nr:MAG: transketolase [Zetaproteobacteria bacterium]
MWTEDDVRAIEERARQIRRDVVTMIHLAGDGHPGPALSIADLVAALYFKILRVNPADPHWEGRDRFVLSKGHACPSLYAALARRGFFSPDLLPSLRSLGSILQGHPVMGKTPGVDSTSGSLGNGISIGLGMALGGRVNDLDYFTYVIAGDGEIQEGIVWEAAMAAAHYKVGRLIVMVDHNGQQSGGPVRDVSGLYPILPKWEAFGWHCQEIDGHDPRAILDAVSRAQDERERPSCIVARTVKGKGIPFMEADNSWHKRVPTKAELDEALAILA